MTTVEVKDKKIVITMDLVPPTAGNISKSGKTHVVAGTGGFVKTDAIEPVSKRPISIGVNVTVPTS